MLNVLSFAILAQNFYVDLLRAKDNQWADWYEEFFSKGSGCFEGMEIMFAVSGL